MIKTTVFALLCLLSLQQTVLIASQTSNTVTVPSMTVVAEPYHSANNPNYLGSSVGAQWIWKTGGQSWPDGDTLTFEANFYSDCANTAELRITADNIFSASVNGGAALTGNDWTKVYTFKVANLICGSNKLSVKVTNKDQNSAAALIFAVVQDQSGCYKCQSPASFYNPYTCKCQCVGGCDCGAPNSIWEWTDYPTCGCQCKNRYYVKCANFYNPKTCNCECRPKACPPGQIQSLQTCQCVKSCVQNQMCVMGKVWDLNQCKCVCAKNQICSPPLTWDENNCKCSQSCLPLACPKGQYWDSNLCKCSCMTKIACPTPSFWNDNICGCDGKVCPANIICLPNQTIDYNSCTCVPRTDCLPINCGIAMTYDTSKCACVPLFSGCTARNCGIFEKWNPLTCTCQSILSPSN